jgi:hypothetical protein
VDEQGKNAPQTKEAHTDHADETAKQNRKEKTPRLRSRYKQEPDWKPTRFDGLWTFYPVQGRKSRQAAIRAWDRLHPDDELIDKIAVALIALKESDEWQRGIGIPYVSTFLNQHRWEDAAALPDETPSDDPNTPRTGAYGWAPEEAYY